MTWGTLTESAFLSVDDDFEFFVDAVGDPLVIALNPGESASLAFNIDDAGSTDNLEIEIVQGHRVSSGNTLDAATGAGTALGEIQLDTAADGFSSDDDLNGMFLAFITSGTLRGQGKLITDSQASDDSVVVENAFSATPSAGDPYALYRAAPMRYGITLTAAASDEQQGNLRVTVYAEDGQYVLARARRTGTTDAHRVRMSYQVDGISV